MRIQERILSVEEHDSPTLYGETVYSRLRLKGKWLTDAGFKPNDKVHVFVRNGELVIKKIESDVGLNHTYELQPNAFRLISIRNLYLSRRNNARKRNTNLNQCTNQRPFKRHVGQL